MSSIQGSIGIKGNTVNVFPEVIKALADPQSHQYQFPLGQLWLNTVSEVMWYLANKENNTATWLAIETGVIPGTDEFDTDSGTAIPVAGVINIFGGANINTAGAGNTVTAALNADVVTNSYMTVGPNTLTIIGDQIIASNNLILNPIGSVFINSIGTGAVVATADELSAVNGTANFVLTSNGALLAPSFQAPAASSISITGDTGGAQIGNAFTFNGGTTGLSFNGAATVFTTTFAGITANDGTVSLATDATTSTVNIGTGAGAKTVTLGSTNSTSLLALRYGTADMNMASATGTVMSALDTGEITMPLQPAFLATLSATTAGVTGAGGAYTLIANTEIFDQGNDYNNATGIFTAPVTGRYNLAYNILVGSLTVAMSASLGQLQTSNRNYSVNILNIGAIRTLVTGADRAALNYSTLADMDVADTAVMVFTVSNGAGNTATANASSSFSGFLAC